jgi:SMI1-KNR4 cell-wall
MQADLGVDLGQFWCDSEYARSEYVSELPSDDLVRSVERELGYRLPASYVLLMKRHNGGMPVNNYCPAPTPTSWAEDHVAITGVMGIGRTKARSLCGSTGSRFWIEMWEYPEIGVYFADCPSGGHDLIAFDYRSCGPEGEPQVVHVDQELDYKVTPLAEDFQSFIKALLPETAFSSE